MKFWTGVIIGALVVIVAVLLALTVNVSRKPLPQAPAQPSTAPATRPAAPTTGPATAP